MLEELLRTPCGRKAAQMDPEIQKMLNNLDKEGALGKPAGPKSKIARAQDIGFEFYINVLLSNPMTHVTNAVSNMVPITTRIAETLAAATSSKVFRNIEDRTLYTEALAEVHGVAEGFVEAFRFAKVRFSSISKTNPEILTAQNIPEQLAAQAKIEWRLQNISSKNFDFTDQWVNRAIDYTGAAVNTPGKSLSASDTFFKIISYRAEIAKQSFHEAAGKKGQTSKQMWDEYRRIKNETFDGNNPKIVEKGIADADFRTYTNKPEGKLNAWMATKGHDVAGLRWIVPFRRTMTNILSYGLESSPLALSTSKTRRALFSGSPAERDAAIGRMAAGTAFLTATYFMLGDRLDGDPPQNPQARDLWEKDGHERDTMRVVGMNIPLDMFGPLGPLFKAMARYQQLASNVDYDYDDEPDNTIITAAEDLSFAIADSLVSEHWVSSLADGVDVIKQLTREDSPRAAYAFASKFTAQFIPAGIKKGPTRWVDPYVKDITNPFDAIISKITFASKTVENKVDLWGDDMRYDHFLDPSLADPITGKDPVSVEMRRVKMRIPETRRMQGGVEMTPKEYKQFLVYSGKGVAGLPPLREELRARMAMPLYKRYDTDVGRAEFLRDGILLYRQNARAAILQDPNFNLAERVQKKQEFDAKQRGVSQ